MHKITTAYDRVKTARSVKRPTALSYIEGIFTDFFEFHGDRRFADDHAIVCGVARLEGKPVTVIGIEKGRSTKERTQRNFGAPGPEGYRKALRLMKQAEKFHRPVICFIDTSGANCGIGAEERGQGQAIAENLMEMMTLNTPLWKAAGKAADAAENLKLTAQDALTHGIIERIMSENDIGHESFYVHLRQTLAQEIQKLEISEDLLEARYDRFRRIGVPILEKDNDQ